MDGVVTVGTLRGSPPHLQDDSPASYSGYSGDTASPPKEGGKRKKTLRACHHCQKAHLTCDDSRPCGRCVKRGFADTCADGARKKAKYLRDFEEALLARSNSGDGVTPTADQAGTEPTEAMQPQFSIDSSTAPPSHQNGPQLVYDSTLTPAARLQGRLGGSAATPPDLGPFFSSNDFGSEAAGFEYAILSSMLNGGGFSTDSPLPMRNDGASRGDGPGTPGAGGSFLGGLNADDAFRARPSTSGAVDNPSSFLQIDRFGAPSASSAAPSDSLFAAVPPQNGCSAQHAAASNAVGQTTAPFVPTSDQGQPSVTGRSRSTPQPDARSQRPPVPTRTRPPIMRPPGQAMTPDDVYRNITKPYRYTDSYHFLIRHLRERFEKNDILRVVRALAIYRPSLIALQMPLTEEDEIFVEKCFQRTVIELDRLISFSGTPTVVWRRTGEIACVGMEFCLLTEWSREQLLSKKKFIYELFDTSSTVEYYEAFATHAFENTTQAVMTTCVLLTPKGRPVPCTCCFTIKRDLFNCPSLVIGSFLPILSG